MDAKKRFQELRGWMALFGGIVLLPFLICFAKIARRIPGKALRHKGGTLQTAVVFFRHPETERSIIFVSSVHLGEADYFKTVQRIINAHPSHRVLYEMIKKLTQPQLEALTKDERLALKRFSGAESLLQGAKVLLNVTHQKEGLTYRQDWVNTDMSMIDILRAMVEKKLHLDEETKQWFQWEENPMLAWWLLDVVLRNLLPATRLVRYFSFLFRGQRDFQKLLVTERNKVAIAAISEHIKEGHVLTIWGGEHFSGIEGGIQALGFTEVSRMWVDAYHSRGHTLLKAIRGMV